MAGKFILHSNYKPTGDRPEAINKPVEGLNREDKEQVLPGVTGSGKTFTRANVIARVNHPTLVLAHNKTLGSTALQRVSGAFLETGMEYFVIAHANALTLCFMQALRTA